MLEFQSKQFLNDSILEHDLTNKNQEIQHQNFNSQKQEKQKEKHALNQLRLISEYVEYNESFGAWGDESLIAAQENHRKSEKQKSDYENLTSKQKMMFKNTLNEMSQALCNLEKGNKKNGHLMIPKQKLKGNLQAKEKAKVVQYEFDSVDIISDLKKLRDDLQESPDRLAKVKTNNILETILPQKCASSQDQKYNKQKSQLSFNNDNSIILMNANIQLNNDNTSNQDQNPTYRSRSISTTTNSRARKDSQIMKQSCETHVKTQEGSFLSNGQFSNLLGSCGNNKVSNVQNIRYPINGCNANYNIVSQSNQEKGILHYIIKMKSKEINNGKTKECLSKNSTICQNTVGLSTAVSETAPATPSAQSYIQTKQNQNFIIQKKLGRQLFDFENKQNKVQTIQNNPNSINSNEFSQSLNQTDKMILKRESKTQNIISEDKHLIKQPSSSQKKIEQKDTLKNYKQIMSARTEIPPKEQNERPQQEPRNEQQNQNEEMYNFESSSKFLLKKCVSSSFQQNEEISKDNSNSISISMSNSKRMSCQEINANRQSSLLLIQDESEIKQNLATQPIEQNENIIQRKRKSITQQVRQDIINVKQKSKENISQQDVLKIQFFEKVKNKIMQSGGAAPAQSSTHRVSHSLNLNKNQNICQLFSNQTNFQTPINSQSITPTSKHNKTNLNNNQNISFSRAIATNNLPFQKKDMQVQRGSYNFKSSNRNAEEENQVGNNLCIKSNSLPKKFSKQEQENLPISNQDKKFIKNYQNINEIKVKVPIVQMLTNRISRESNLLMSNILKEKNINISSQNLNQKESQQNQNVYKSISLSMNPFNNNYFENTDQEKNITPKNIQNNSKQSQLQSFSENRQASLLPQQQIFNPAKVIKNTKQIPNIPKPVNLKIKQIETEYDNNQ